MRRFTSFACACGRVRHRLRRRLGEERGIALAMALGIMSVLLISGTTIVYFSSANARSSSRSSADQKAYAFAEAGMNDALSVLENALDPRTGTLLAQKTVSFEGGSATYSGTIDANYLWTITSIGSVRSPSGVATHGQANAQAHRPDPRAQPELDRNRLEPLLPGRHDSVPDDRLRQLARARLDPRRPLSRQRRHDHGLDHHRRRRRQRHHHRARHDTGGARSDRRVRLDELDERLHEQQRLRDQRDLRQLHGRDALRDRVRLRRPVERDHPRHSGQRDPQGDRREHDPGSRPSSCRRQASRPGRTRRSRGTGPRAT